MKGRLSVSVDSVQPIENEAREVNRVQSCSPKEDNEKSLKETEEGGEFPSQSRMGGDLAAQSTAPPPSPGVGASQDLISFQTEELRLN